jgi:hypothetical protein
MNTAKIQSGILFQIEQVGNERTGVLKSGPRHPNSEQANSLIFGASAPVSTVPLVSDKTSRIDFSGL